MSAHDQVRIWGPEAIEFIQGQISQDVVEMDVGETRWSFLLKPQGKVEVLFEVTKTAADELLCACDGGYGELLQTSLERFKLRIDVSFELTLATEPPLDDAHRIEAGLPRMGIDIDESTIPNESGFVERAASFTKGCYRGQELVERIASRGGKRRMLRKLILEGKAVPPAGAEVEGGGAVTSAAWSADREATVALAYVKGDVEVPGDVVVTWDGSSAIGIVVELPS